MATFINPAGYLKIILGPMTSGKTTELIKEYNRHIAGGFKCCFINHSTDDRYGSGNSKTSTHNKSVVNKDLILLLLSTSINPTEYATAASAFIQNPTVKYSASDVPYFKCCTS